MRSTDKKSGLEYKSAVGQDHKGTVARQTVREASERLGERISTFTERMAREIGSAAAAERAKRQQEG